MNYFQNAREFTINGGNFGQDYSRHTAYHGPVHRVNDHSKHTTNYGGYVNHGQHAAGGGTINNRGPQTTESGSIYGNQHYPGSRAGNRRSPRPSSPSDIDDQFNASSRSPNPPGQQYRRRYPPQGPPSHTTTYGRDYHRNTNHDDDDDDVDDYLSSEEERPRSPPSRKAQPPKVPSRRPQGERPGNLDGHLEEELGRLTPETQRYIKELMQQRNGAPMPPARTESDLQDRMANMQLHDGGESSRPPAGRNSPRGHRQDAPRRRSKPLARTTRVPPPARVVNSSEDESGSEGDSDHVPLHGTTIITSTDSQNVNNTTVVDSHNDNSTRTEISKTFSAQ